MVSCLLLTRRIMVNIAFFPDKEGYDSCYIECVALLFITGFGMTYVAFT